MAYIYERDEPHIKAWVAASKTPETAKIYLDKYIHDLRDHSEYLALIGQSRLDQLKSMVPR
jgi:hypothetical protein